MLEGVGTLVFRVNGRDCVLRRTELAELARRVRKRASSAPLGTAVQAAAVYLEQATITVEVSELPPMTPDESETVRTTIEAWELEDGFDALPSGIRCLRHAYALESE
jgi:hypothetical protein